jgi:hypothetical protein
MRRPLSGRKHFANIIIDAEKNEEIQKTKQGVDIQPKTKLNVVKDGVSVRHFSVSLSLSVALTVSLSLSFFVTYFVFRMKHLWLLYKGKLLKSRRKRLSQ